MADTINVKLLWEDKSTGDEDEDGQVVRIYTDSPSFKPTDKIDYAVARHPWMQLRPIAAGEEELIVTLALPVTFVKFQVRQYNARGYGDWSVPKLLPITSASSGVGVPPPPDNLGLSVVGASTPPPVPTDPPPTPPVTGGGGVTSNYVFTSQYSGVQGQSQWSYLDSSGTLLVYDAANSKWNGNELYLAVWNGGFRHSSSGTLKDCIVRFTVPATGVADITGVAQLYSAPGNVTFIIKHNSTTKFSQAMTDTTPYPYSITALAVTAGDTIDFISRFSGGSLSNNNNAVLAPTINLTTDGTTAVNPTLASLLPTTFTLAVGSAQPLVVALSSPAIEAAVITLSSTDVAKITVPASITIPIGSSSKEFTATGVAVGGSTIEAAYNSSTKQSIGSVVAPASGAWANAPAGGALLHDVNFSNLNGLFDVYGTTILTTDVTAPFSPSGVGLARLEARAMYGGNQLEYATPVLYREMYFGLYWRTNPQFQGRISGNKLFFLRGPGTNGVFSMVGGPNMGQSSFRLVWSHNSGHLDNSHIMGSDLGLGAEPNVGNGTLVPGVWYKIECHIRASTTTTSRDGFIRWWLNGVLIGSYNQFNYAGLNSSASNPGTMNQWLMTQTWDGSGDMGTSNTVPWEHYIDHLRLVGRN